MIAARELAVGRTRLGEGFVDETGVCWVASRPQDSGRTSLWKVGVDGGVIDVTPGADVRTSIHEYGGTAVAVDSGRVVFFDRSTRRMWYQDSTTRAPLTTEGRWRWGAPTFLAHGRVVCVREDISRDLDEPVDALVVLDLGSMNEHGGTVIASGADFYQTPTVSSTGRIAWMEWDHPHMPWAESRIVVRESDGSKLTVHASPGVSAVYPQWDCDGTLVFLTDESGYWTFYRWDGESVSRINTQSHDFCDPPWVLTRPPYALLPDHRIGCSWWEDSRAHLGWIDGDGTTHTLLISSQASPSPCDESGKSVIGLGFEDAPYGLYTLDWISGSLTELTMESSPTTPLEAISLPEELSWRSSDTGGSVYGWLYRAQPQRGVSPLLVTSHAGPTSFSPATYSLVKQYFTSHGISVLDVNYSGSSGYGREYRDRLTGKWGVVDVRDCVDGALHVISLGLADPQRVAIMGSSAGGFTALAALTTTDTFSAGISMYGISDLEALSRDTTKFEAHYNDWLIAAYPEGVETYRERSPLHHLSDLSCPLLILQGGDDPVVPLDQATAMYEAVKAKGCEAQLIVYPKEGHGFRDAATIEDAYTRILDFLIKTIVT